jgi:hypothetical protein
MHHIHMSTGFMFVIAFFVVGLLAVIFAFIVSLKRSKPEYRSAGGPSGYVGVASVGGGPRVGPATSHPSNFAPQQAASYVQAAAPVYMHGGSSSDLFTGVLLGEAMAGGFGGHNHDTTVIHETSSPSHSAASSDSSWSSSSSSDSGFSYSDSGSSFDSGSSSGGFDASW